VSPSFRERVHEGGKQLRNVFCEEVCEAGMRIATAPLAEAYSKFVSVAKRSTGQVARVMSQHTTSAVFAFPGTGLVSLCYSQGSLRGLPGDAEGFRAGR